MFKKKISFSFGLILLMLLFSFNTFAKTATKKVVPKKQTVKKVVPAIPTVKIHYQRADKNYDNMTIWAWEGAVGKTAWPEGYAKKGNDDFGIYFEIPLKSKNEEKVGFLFVNSKTGEKDGEDRFFNLKDAKEVWVYGGQKFEYYSKPKNLATDSVRVHYKRADKDYKPWTLWVWSDVVFDSSKGWPNGIKSLGNTSYGVYFDVKVNGTTIGMKPAHSNGDGDGGDRNFKKLDKYRELFIADGVNNVYGGPDMKVPEGIEKAEVLSDTKLKLSFTTPDVDSKTIKIADKNGKNVEILSSTNDKNDLFVEVAKIDENTLPYSVVYEGATIETTKGFAYIDNLYAYSGNDLGPTLNADGTATLKMWSPLVKDVKVIVYDKNDQNKVVADNVQMVKGNRGVWSVVLNEKNTGLKNLNAYFYQYKIDASGEGDYVLALDPYAKSMAPWNNKGGNGRVGKGAIINPSNIGPKLDYAKIDGYTKREDAIIYEVHVRDLTVDPSIEGQLKSGRFGTFKALIDKLPYIKSLGVTHVQLLPIMSYYFADELNSSTREMNWSSGPNNYNWGYDPHSYFSLSGMYSENPSNPEQRITEFKELVNAIHKAGMGVTLDVVFNHTSNVFIFEDLAPGYYHFMDKNGRPKSSFGGGRLGTTHAMARKVLVDSILYWTKEFKVDGFRFDMMGDHDAEAIQMAFDEAKKINPNIHMIGEGWRTFTGDDGDPRQAADQDWMKDTSAVGVFSDEIRNALKSGFGSEGQPRFLTTGKRNIGLIFDNIKAQPRNFEADEPGDVVQYIEAHDNLTLYDVIAQSIKKDPDLYDEEIHKRIRIGNTIILTSQGTAFIHAGQEYGRTKQWREDGTKPKDKVTTMKDAKGNLFKFPHFIHDSYDSSDRINMFDWAKATDKNKFPVSTQTVDYTKGLIELRKSTDAFRLGSKELVEENVNLLFPTRSTSDLIIAYSVKATNGDEYIVLINADMTQREFALGVDVAKATVLVDGAQAGTKAIANPVGVSIKNDKVTLQPLTAVVLKK